MLWRVCLQPVSQNEGFQPDLGLCLLCEEPVLPASPPTPTLWQSHPLSLSAPTISIVTQSGPGKAAEDL